MRRRELVGCAAAAMLHIPGIRIQGNESPWEPDGLGWGPKGMQPFERAWRPTRMAPRSSSPA